VRIITSNHFHQNNNGDGDSMRGNGVGMETPSWGRGC